MPAFGNLSGDLAMSYCLDKTENQADYMDFDTASAFFRAIVEAPPALSEAA